jgi:hypothetical protein
VTGFVIPGRCAAASPESITTKHAMPLGGCKFARSVIMDSGHASQMRVNALYARSGMTPEK